VIRPDSAKSLDDYEIFLQECQLAVEALVLEYSEHLKNMVKKMSYHLHERWRSIVYDTKHRCQTVQISQLVAFVTKEAKKANDPIYGKSVLNAHPVLHKGDR
jgi:hypothetical protein